jgi:hypothetical protein
MFVYIVTVNEATRSFMSGIYATKDLAEDERKRIRAIFPFIDISVTETEVIGFDDAKMGKSTEKSINDSWVGQVDRQGGSFTDNEIAESATRW